MNNYVLVKPAVDTTKIKMGNIELHMPVSPADGKPYDPYKSQPIVCGVVTPPRKLIFGKRKIFWETVEELDLPPETKAYLYKVRKEAKFSETTLIDAPVPESMMWKTPVEIKENDIVWVNSNALMWAAQKNETIEADGKVLYMIKYEQLYMKKTGPDVVMLNGWVLSELIDEPQEWVKKAEDIGLEVPRMFKSKEFNDRVGVVKYSGKPVEYLFEDRYDHPQIKVGDVVLFEWKVNRRLEPGLKFFAKDKDMIVTRRCNIMGILS
jgi:hypothetical protein